MVSCAAAAAPGFAEQRADVFAATLGGDALGGDDLGGEGTARAPVADEVHHAEGALADELGVGLVVVVAEALAAGAPQGGGERAAEGGVQLGEDVADDVGQLVAVRDGKAVVVDDERRGVVERGGEPARRRARTRVVRARGG